MKIGIMEIKILWTDPDVDSRVLIKFAWLIFMTANVVGLKFCDFHSHENNML